MSPFKELEARRIEGEPEVVEGGRVGWFFAGDEAQLGEYRVRAINDTNLKVEVTRPEAAAIFITPREKKGLGYSTFDRPRRATVVYGRQERLWVFPNNSSEGTVYEWAEHPLVVEAREKGKMQRHPVSSRLERYLNRVGDNIDQEIKGASLLKKLLIYGRAMPIILGGSLIYSLAKAIEIFTTVPSTPPFQRPSDEELKAAEKEIAQN